MRQFELKRREMLCTNTSTLVASSKEEKQNVTTRPSPRFPGWHYQRLSLCHVIFILFRTSGSFKSEIKNV